jgi:hypothetical protein
MGRLKIYPFLFFSSIELVGHIDGLLKPDMPWSGYGDIWNIDHKRPLSIFFNETAQDVGFKECWSLDNLRPMLIAHNLSKGPRADGNWTLVE